MASGYSFSPRISINSMNKFQEQLESWNDSVNAMTLKQPWLQTMFSIIIHAGSITKIQNCKEQKRQNSRQQVRAMTYQLRANKPGRIIAHRGRRIWHKKLVSSADNLLRLSVFIKQRHFKWTVGCGPVQSYMKTHNCWGDSVPGTG